MSTLNTACVAKHSDIQVQILCGEFVYLKNDQYGRTKIEAYDRKTVFAIEVTAQILSSAAVYRIGYAFSKEHAKKQLQDFAAKNPEVNVLEARIIEYDVSEFQNGDKRELESFAMEL